MPKKQEDVNKIKYLTRKNPTLQKVFFEMLEKDPVDYDIVKETYELYQTYKNLLNNRGYNIRDYKDKKFEDLFDDISVEAINNEKRKYALSFVSKKYAHLLDEKSYELFDSIKEMNLPHEKVNDLVAKKIAKYKKPSEFNEALSEFIDSSRNDNIDAIKKKIEEQNLNAKIKKEDHSQNLLLLEIEDYKASNKLGSRSWCISTSKSLFQSYLHNGRGLSKKQYFLWDFSKPASDNSSFIAFTMAPDKKITASHKKNDAAISSRNMKKILDGFNIEIEPYTKEDILTMSESKKIPIETRLSYVLKFMEVPMDKSYLKKIMKEQNITKTNWGNASDGIKSPDLFFEVLEDIYESSKRNTRAFKNLDAALVGAVIYNGRAIRQDSKASLPIDLKYFWSWENYEKLLKEDIVSAKILNGERNKNQNWIYKNEFDIDLLDVFRKFKSNDKLTVQEKKEVVGEIFQKYPKNITENVMDKFFKWNKDIFNSEKVVSSLINAFADDIKTFNEFSKRYDIDEKTILDKFINPTVIKKVIKKEENIENLTQEQKNIIKEKSTEIKLESYRSFVNLKDNDLMSYNIIKNSINEVLKDASFKKIDLNQFKELIDFMKKEDGNCVSLPVNSIRHILRNDEDLSKINHFLSESNDAQSRINVIKAVGDDQKQKVFELVVSNTQDINVAGHVLNEFLVNRTNNMSLANKKKLAKNFFEEFPPDNFILEENGEFQNNKKSKFKSVLVNIIDKGTGEMVGDLMKGLTKEAQKELLLKTKKGEDPVVAFLLEKEGGAFPKNNNKNSRKSSYR